MLCMENLHPCSLMEVTLKPATYLTDNSTPLQLQSPPAGQQWALQKLLRRDQKHNKDSEVFIRPPNSPEINLIGSDGMCGEQPNPLRLYPSAHKDLNQKICC